MNESILPSFNLGLGRHSNLGIQSQFGFDESGAMQKKKKKKMKGDSDLVEPAEKKDEPDVDVDVEEKDHKPHKSRKGKKKKDLSVCSKCGQIMHKMAKQKCSMCENEQIIKAGQKIFSEMEEDEDMPRQEYQDEDEDGEMSLHHGDEDEDEDEDGEEGEMHMRHGDEDEDEAQGAENRFAETLEHRLLGLLLFDRSNRRSRSNRWNRSRSRLHGGPETLLRSPHVRDQLADLLRLVEVDGDEVDDLGGLQETFRDLFARGLRVADLLVQTPREHRAHRHQRAREGEPVIDPRVPGDRQVSV